MSTIENATDQTPEADTPETAKPAVGEGKYQAAMLRKESDELRAELEAKEAEIKRLRNKLIEKHGSRKSEEGVDGEPGGGEAETPRLKIPSLELAAAKAALAARDEELKKAGAEAADMRDKYLRARAELENVIRRTEREKADASRYAISDFARDVLGIGDNIQRAMAAVPPDASQNDPALASFLEGVQLLERELLATLERYGVVRVDPMRERFDPNQHQAVMEMEDTEVPQGTVVKVFQAGFTIADRVLRPAIVAVSRGGAKVPKPGPDAASATAAEPPPTAVSDEASAEIAMPSAANDDPPVSS